MVPHLIRADVRRFRLAILGWIALEGVFTAITAIDPSLSGDVPVARALDMAASLLWLAMQCIAAIVTVLIVQADALVGTDAFWTTRPIPPRTLLTAKAILLGALMIAIPVAADLALMAIHHVPAGPAARVALQSALFDALWLALVTAGAVVTANLASFAMLVGGVFGCLATTIALQLAYAATHENVRPPASAPPQIDDPTGAAVALVLSIGALFTGVHAQYRTRSRWRSCAVGAAALCLASTLADIWPWPVLRPHVIVPGWAYGESALRLTADPDTVSFDNSTGSRTALWRTAQGRVSVSGVDNGWVATVGLENGSVELENGVRLSSAGGAYPSTVPMGADDDHPEYLVTKQVLGVRRLSGSLLRNAERAIVLILRDDELNRHLSRTGRYLGRFSARLMRKDAAGVLPLQAGATYQDGPYRLALEDVSVTLPTIQIRARQSTAVSMFDRRPAPSYAFYLRNAAHGEAAGGFAFDASHSSIPASFGFHRAEGTFGFAATGIAIRFPADFGAWPQPFTITASWLEGAELVIVRTQQEGSVERTLDIPNFRLQQQATKKDDVGSTK